jgi:hypothetical protein
MINSMNKIIDIHGHLGDILRGEDIIYQKNKMVPPSKDEDLYYQGLKLALSRFIDPNGKLFSCLLNEKSSQKAVNAHTPRNNACTLENMGKVMDDNHISGMVALPIHPYVTFEDVLEASKVDGRIIPFTSIDYTLGRNAGKKLLEDVKNGARGPSAGALLHTSVLLNRICLIGPCQKPSLFSLSTEGAVAGPLQRRLGGWSLGGCSFQSWGVSLQMCS